MKKENNQEFYVEQMDVHYPLQSEIQNEIEDIILKGMPQKISFPVHTQNARSALLSKGLRAFCIHVCNLFYQFRLNSASVRSGFFCSAQRMLHSLLKMSRLCPRKSCTHFVSEARLSAVGSVPSLVIQRM